MLHLEHKIKYYRSLIDSQTELSIFSFNGVLTLNLILNSFLTYTTVSNCRS
jgi:hypothetical protein